MVFDAKPARGMEERRPVSGTITLLSENPTLNIDGELRDVSPSGIGIAHDCALLKPGCVARILCDNLEKKVRVMWVRDFGDRIESGLLHQDTYLILRARGGDGEAFSELVGPYLPALHRTIRSMLHNPADAEEAIQEALLKVTLHLDRFRCGSDFRPWLFRIATREALKHLRWNRIHSHDLLYAQEKDNGCEQKLIEQIADPGGSPAEILERKEFIIAISAALESLNEIYRRIFVACDLRQVPITEAAGLFGINIDTANTQLHRARLLMRKQLRRNYPPGRISIRRDVQTAKLGITKATA
jgi:RNA polymerase sigma-70 factor (ECF subfamily)